MPSCRALTAKLALLTALSACGNIEKPVDETFSAAPVGFGCLDRAGEVADDPLNPDPAPFCRIGLLGAVEIAGRPVPTVAVLDRGPECRRTPKGYAVDLAPGVAARFHEAFQLDPDFVPLADSPACPPLEGSGPVEALPGGARTALEFTTAATVAAPNAAGGGFVVPAAVTARLVEAGSGRVLWQDTCRTDTSELEAAATFPDIGNLRRVLSGEAERCAQGFAAALGAPAPL